MNAGTGVCQEGGWRDEILIYQITFHTWILHG